MEDVERAIRIIDESIEIVEKEAYWMVSDGLKDIKKMLTILKEKKEGDGSFVVIDTKTGKEADQYDIALHEEWARHLCYCDMDGWAIQDDGSLLLLDECGRFAYADRERFKVVWDV